MKKQLIYLLSFLSASVFSQGIINGEKELLTNIPLGENPQSVRFYANDEGIFSPGSPYVDVEGRLIFGSKKNDSPYLIVNADRKVFAINPGGLQYPISLLNTTTSSQQGIGTEAGLVYIFLQDHFLSYNYRDKTNKFRVDNSIENYPVPFGTILRSSKTKQAIAVAFDDKNPSASFSVVMPDELEGWLATQPGLFSIGVDGAVYRNGTIWSATRPKEFGPSYIFIGKIESGHFIWRLGERDFVISNGRGDIELRMQLPWATGADHSFNVDTDRYSTQSLGPWGELYCLIAPQLSRNRDSGLLVFPETGSAELIVVRNHLKYFGRLNDGGVRLRKAPTTTGEILGTYPAKTGFRILEKGTKEETIGGQKNVWYKVRLLDGKEGWFFGSFVQNLYDGPNGKPLPWPNVPDW